MYSSIFTPSFKMSRSILNCFKLCFLVVYCSATKILWELSDYRTSGEIPEKTLKVDILKKHRYDNLWYPGNRNGIKQHMRKLKQSLPGIKLTPEQMTKFKIWPKATIPFYIDEFSYDKVLRDQIRDHLDHASFLTGLNFEEIPDPPKDEKERWVLFVNRRGQLDCKDYSTNSFTNSGVQKVILGYDCLRSRGPMAAIVLALAGVPPQHNAPNRDSFIKVSMESIIPEKRGLFKALKDDDWLFRDLPYDYGSVSHYPSYRYTVDGSATIRGIAKESVKKRNLNWMDIIKENNEYTYVDLGKIIMLYKNIMTDNSNRDKKKCKNYIQPIKGRLNHPQEYLSELEYEKR